MPLNRSARATKQRSPDTRQLTTAASHRRFSMASVTLKGNPINLKGTMPKVGAKAPDFKLTKSDLSSVDLGALGKKKKVVVTVPSLDTSVCQMETRKFNEKAAGLGDVEVLIVSADLPFAQKRFCETEGLKSVTAAS